MVLPYWSADLLSQHSCANRSHVHISTTERDDLLRNHLVEMHCSRCGGALQSCACARPRFTIARLYRVAALRGFSCKYGELLAAIRDQGIGQVMVANIKRRPIEEPHAGLQ